MKTKLHLPDIVGKGYKSFWEFTGRYRVVKGSRGSKKSKTTAINLIYRIVKYKNSNALVVRKVKDTLRDSCFSDLKWAISRLKVDKYFESSVSPLEIRYKPTGQKILFRGLDDPLKIASISVEKGAINFLWIEEAYEIMNESDFNMIDESIRGIVENGLFKQITLTFNPWNERHWIKKRFFDVKDDPDILALTTDYRCNEWLDESDINLFENMKKNNPKRYNVAGLGNWGVVEGLVFENWKEQHFDVEKIKNIEGIKTAFGMDFGYTNDPSALFCSFVDTKNKTIYVFDEIYKKGLSNERLFELVEQKGYAKERIVADSAEPKSIDRLRDLGMNRIKGARKGKDSINNGIDFIQDFRIIVHPSCVNFLTEISNYSYATDKFGKTINKPTDDFNHLMDAMRYGMEDISRGNIFSFD